MGRFIPPDPTKGDESTVGGYAAVHARPVAFEGPDGMSYSVEIATDETGDAAAPVGAYVLFLRWARVGEQKVEGHLETDFLARGASEGDVVRAVGAMPLAEIKALLYALVREASGGSSRRWWDVMKDEA
ncbi:MAG: hypothetical protein ABJD07_00130 [Gemmatimonadaceae bacterium]